MKSNVNQKVFKRIEKKYLITRAQHDKILDTILLHTNPDSHRKETIFSLYFDTPAHTLIRRSIDKPVYKEKLRLRAYGVPGEDAQVFAEIKKKYKKTVYKRRAFMKYSDARAFLESGNVPIGYDDQKQILNEIQWFIKCYPGLAPSMLISYDRTAYYGTEDRNLRITFDGNLLWRDSEFFPIEGAWGSQLLDPDQLVMEIKIPDAMPLWLVELLSENEIYPTSFSKVGTAYKQKLLKGGINYA